MNEIFRRLRIFDYLIFAVIMSLALWTGFFLYAEKAGARNLVVEAPSGKWIYPLTDSRTVSIPGALGETVIRIENNTVFILDSPCPNKTCMSASSLKKNGDWNACLPNKIFLHIEGTQNEDEILLQN